VPAGLTQISIVYLVRFEKPVEEEALPPIVPGPEPLLPNLITPPALLAKSPPASANSATLFPLIKLDQVVPVPG
jgi:hypothetical protein